MGVGFHSDFAASGYLGQSKKVTCTAASAAELISNASSHLGVCVRVISMDGSYVSFGNSTLEVDTGTAPGSLVITNVMSGLILNFTGGIYAITDSGSASIAVQPINADGFGPDNRT